ncbi:MAG: sulfurtransferase TusA family protein [Tannerellaceae bacterium]|nr:sulfurtransferase TusA family protein [Tannerellaceae bacterium]
MYKLPATLTDDIQSIDSLIREYTAGRLEEVRFKAVRVPMGIYEQRKNGTYMVRVRCTGGYISPEQLLALAQTAKAVEAPFLHITTRQEIQIHSVTLDKIKSILEPLQQTGLGTKGGGGNTIRNIMVDIRAGIDEKEVFDPFPYAADLTTFLIAQNDSFTLPRKLKIAFAISEEEADLALVNDLGFIPRIVNGERGFKVYLGGSVASKPTKGWLLFDFIPEKDFFRVALAVKRFFSENGNRKNRHQARIRHIFYKLGEEETLARFRPYFEETLKDDSLNYTSSIVSFNYHVPEERLVFPEDTEAYSLWKKRYVTRQKQDNRFAVLIPFLHGNGSPDLFEELAHFTARFGNDVIRFTTRQHIQLRNIPEEWLPAVWQLVNRLELNTIQPLLVNDIISCTGADTCRLGICFSKGAAKAIQNRLAKSKLPLDGIEPIKVNISGCSNSCAQQVWADIGFSGRVSRNERMFPAYTVYGKINGRDELAQPLGLLAARDLPAFTEALFVNYLNRKNEFSSFGEYIRREGNREIKELIASFLPIPGFDEDKNYYYDWGADEPFSVSERGKAECSAGLFDMIDLDKDIILKSGKELEATDDSQRQELLLADIAYSASRMLLITKGAEPRTTEDSFDLFRQLFIEDGLIDKKYIPVVEAAKRKEQLLSLKEDILKLGDEVIELYGTMDDSLQFKQVPHQLPPQPPKGGVESTPDTIVKDFRGVGCPMNFVKTKLALATLPTGGLLEIWIDDGAPIENVPGSVRNEGHEIVSTTQEKDFWKVLIRK